MEGIANELVAYLDYIGLQGDIDLRAREDGGFYLNSGFIYVSKDPDMRKLYNDIVIKLRNPRTRVPSLREKLEEFKENTIRMAFSVKDEKLGKYVQTGKSVEKFKEYLKDYYDDDSSSDGSNSTTSTTDELVSAVERMDLSTPPLSVEEQRQLAMKRPFIEEKLADYSDVFVEGEVKSSDKPVFSGMVEATGMNLHSNYGERNAKAKLTASQVNQIRTELWAKTKTARELSREYKVRDETIAQIKSRTNWKHLPQVPGEPDDVFTAPNQQELKILKLAKKHGVEPIRNKIGRLALPPELVKKLRAEKKAEKEKKALE